MKKYILTSLAITTLIFASCSKDDSTKEEPTGSTIACDKLIINDGNKINIVTPEFPQSNSIIASITIKTPNIGQLVDIEIIEQNPVDAIKLGIGSSGSTSNITIQEILPDNTSLFTKDNGINGKIKVTVSGTDCSETVDFSITIIDPNNI